MVRQPCSGIGFCLALAALSAPAVAQEAARETPWRLGDALGAPDWLRISGSIRPRYETLGATFLAGRTGGDELTSLQTLLKVEALAGDFVFGGEILDSRLLSGNAGGGAPGEVNTLEPAQFYAGWRPKNFLAPGASLDVTLGRFTMDLGSRRLVARANYRNLLQSFDGARAVWTSADKLKLTAFYVSPTTREPADLVSALDNEASLDEDYGNVRFGGADIEAPLPLGLVGELYLLELNEDDNASQATRNRDLVTIGARLRRAPAKAAFDLDLEFAGQTGAVRASANPADTVDLDHDAHMLHVEAGYTFEGPWSPRLAFQYDEATGDRSPADLSSERFDALFGDRAFEFGPTGLYGAIARTNLSSPGVRLEVKPDALSDAYLMARRIGLNAPRDSFGGTGVRNPAGASGDDVGLQVEGRYRRWLVQDSLRLNLGAAYLANGDFLETAPNAAREGDSLFAFTELVWTF